MNKEDIQKLIGGYATGSLSDEERLKLFEAALDDQELFDALQQEQSLKDLFDDPFSREMVRRAAAESLPKPRTSTRTSWFRQPWVWAGATSMALAAVLVVALVRWDRTPPPVEKQVAQTAKQTPALPAAPSAEPPSAPSVSSPAVQQAAPPPHRAATVRERPQQPEKTPKTEAPKTPDDHAEVAGRLDRPSGASNESPRGNLGNATGAGTGGNKRDAKSAELARNREYDLRDSNMARKDDQAAAPPTSPAPPAQNQNQFGQRRPAIAAPQPAPSQVQTEQRQQGPPPQQLRQTDQLQVQAQAPPVQPAIAVPESRSKNAIEEKPRAMTTTMAAGELKSARTSQAKSKALGGVTVLSKQAEPPQLAVYSFARQAENGSFAAVSADTVFRPGEIVRVIIAPRVSGPLSIWESDATNPEWRRLFSMTDDKKVSLRARQDFAVPLDIVVQKDQKLRVMTGSAVTYISIRTESLPAK